MHLSSLNAFTSNVIIIRMLKKKDKFFLVLNSRQYLQLLKQFLIVMIIN